MTVRYSLDATWQRHGNVLLAGSPLKLFRTTAAGTRVLERLEAGDDVVEDPLVARLIDAGAMHPLRPRDAPADASVRAARVTVVTPQFRGARVDTDDHAGDGARADGRVTIDDGSVPPLAGATIRLPHNRGPAAARNAARPFVATELVAFVDADVDADPTFAGDWISALLWHFDDPHVGLVAPRVRGEARSPLDLGTQPARIRAGTRVSYVPAAALVVRVAALDELGWFDEGLRFGEDVDLVWRLDQAGWRCRYDPNVTVWHPPRASWSARLRQHFGYGTSAAALAARHPRALSPIHVNGWTAAAWIAGATGHLVTGGAIAVGSAAALERKLPWLPRSVTFGLAMRGHLAGGRQFAHAVRRAWWPAIAGAGVVAAATAAMTEGRRARSATCVLAAWIAASFAADLRAAPTDLAYGAGVWRGMWRRRSFLAVRPRISRWP